MNNAIEQQFFALAKAGDIDNLLNTIEEHIEDDEEKINTTYQWMQVAASYGSEEAEEIADSVYDAVLHVSDETVAYLHFEVAQWFIYGEHGVEQDIKRGIDQLRVAQHFQLRESIQDIETQLLKIRNTLKPEYLADFDIIFPNI